MKNPFRKIHVVEEFVCISCNHREIKEYDTRVFIYWLKRHWESVVPPICFLDWSLRLLYKCSRRFREWLKEYETV